MGDVLETITRCLALDESSPDKSVAQPDGRPRRMLDVSRAEELFGFRTKTSYEAGLKKTIDWYLADHDKTT